MAAVISVRPPEPFDPKLTECSRRISLEAKYVIGKVLSRDWNQESHHLEVKVDFSENVTFASKAEAIKYRETHHECLYVNCNELDEWHNQYIICFVPQVIDGKIDTWKRVSFEPAVAKLQH